jgi:hypothetical protein
VLYQAIRVSGFETWLHTFNMKSADGIPFSEMQMFELQHVLVYGIALAMVVVRHRRVQVLFLGGSIGRVLADLVLAFVTPILRDEAGCAKEIGAPQPRYPLGSWQGCADSSKY